MGVPGASHRPLPRTPACPEAPCLLRTCPSGRPQRGPFASSDVSGLTCSGPRVRPPCGPGSPWGSPTAPSLTRARFFPGSLPHCPASASITVTGRRGRGWSRPRSLMTRLCSRGPSESSHCCPPEPRPPLTSISPNFYVNKVKTKCKPRPPASKLLKETVALRAHCSPLNPTPMLGFGKLSTWRQADTSPFPALGFSTWVGGKSALEQVVGGCAKAFYCSHLS